MKIKILLVDKGRPDIYTNVHSRLLSATPESMQGKSYLLYPLSWHLKTCLTIFLLGYSVSEILVKFKVSD